MNKPFYSQYVLHCMRFYARYPAITHFKSEADRQGWLACKKALDNYKDTDRQILIMVYGGRDTLADNVYMASIKFGINQNEIWNMLSVFEKLVARKRGLI